MTNRSISMPDATYQLIADRAKSEGRTMSEILTEIIDVSVTQAPPRIKAPRGILCQRCVKRDADIVVDEDGRRIATCLECEDEHPRSGRWAFEGGTDTGAGPGLAVVSDGHSSSIGGKNRKTAVR